MSLRFQSPVGVSCDDTGEKRGDDYKFQSPSRGELRLQNLWGGHLFSPKYGGRNW